MDIVNFDDDPWNPEVLRYFSFDVNQSSLIF